MIALPAPRPAAAVCIPPTGETADFVVTFVDLDDTDAEPSIVSLAAIHHQLGEYLARRIGEVADDARLLAAILR